MESKLRDSNIVNPTKLRIENINKASKEDIVPLANGL